MASKLNSIRIVVVMKGRLQLPDSVIPSQPQRLSGSG